MTKRSSIAKLGSMWSAFVVAVVAIAACFGPREAQAQGVAGWGITGFSNIDNLSNNIVKVAAGYYHTVALKQDGTVACWGHNDDGQCNTPANLGTVSAIAAGGDHTVALKQDGTVACWGRNNYGQCNTPANLGTVTAIAAGFFHTVALKNDGTVACWGRNDYGQCNTPSNLGPVTAIAAGNLHTVALKQDGTVACWGYNDYGQCNTPADLGPVSAIAAGGDHTVAKLCSTPSIARTSGNLGAIGAGTPHEFAFTNLPAAAASATLTIRARADLNLASEYLSLKLEGTTQPNLLFVNGANDCPAAPDTATVTIPLKQLTALIADGTLNVRLEASPLVSASQCADGLCEISLRYDTVPVDGNNNGTDDGCEINAFTDCNANGILDSCEIATGAQDKDGDGVLDDCEFARGDFDLDGTVGGADLAVLLSIWGVINPPLGDLDGDGIIGSADLWIFLGNWGAY